MTRAALTRWFAPLSSEQFWGECVGRAAVVGALGGRPPHWPLERVVEGVNRVRVYYPRRWLRPTDAPSGVFFAPEVPAMAQLGASVLIRPSRVPPRVHGLLHPVSVAFGAVDPAVLFTFGSDAGACEVGAAFLVPLAGRSTWRVRSPLVTSGRLQPGHRSVVTLRPGDVAYAPGGAELLRALAGAVLVVRLPPRSSFDAELRRLLVRLERDEVFREPVLLHPGARGRRQAEREAAERIERLRPRGSRSPS